MFILLYFFSFFIVLSGDDWFLIWLGLEVNMLSFILLIYKQFSMMYIESCLKYFFVQSIGSGILMSVFYLNGDLFLYLGSLILSYKMGAGLFFFWFPSVCSGLGWVSCFFLMSTQKIIPLMLMAFFMSWVLWFMMILSLVLGVVGSFNQSQVKRLMAYSSIHHVGWLLMCVILDSSMWMFYLFMYMFVILPVVLSMMIFNIYDLMLINKWKTKWMFVICMLSMAGMPPFLGFFLKWIVFFYMNYVNYEMFLLMIIMSVVMFYIYIRIVYDLVLGVSEENSWFNKKNFKKFFVSVELISMFGIFLSSILMLWILV